MICDYSKSVNFFLNLVSSLFQHREWADGSAYSSPIKFNMELGWEYPPLTGTRPPCDFLYDFQSLFL